MEKEEDKLAKELALKKLAGDNSSPSKLESFLRGGAQSATMGWGDELSAALSALLPTATDKELDRSYSDRYELARDQLRKENEEAEIANPGSYMGGQITGGIATAAAPGLNLGGSLIRGISAGKNALNAAKIGGALAGYGAVQGAGEAEENTLEGAKEGAVSALKAPYDLSKAAVEQAKEGNAGKTAALLGLAGLSALPVVPGKANQKIKNASEQYLKNAKIKNPSPKSFKNVDSNYATKVAKAYEEMQHNPNSPEVKKAYDSLIDETIEQFKIIQKNGLKVSRIEPGMENPYKTSKDLHEDIKKNNHMWYYPTESGFGTQKSTTEHPLLKTTNIKIGGKPAIANDIFRIVHDYFGHAKEGVSFGPKGEEAAYRIHKNMYSPQAQKALATETRGQNSWVNFGPYGKQNRANPKDTIYAEQKAGLLPDWAIEEYE